MMLGDLLQAASFTWFGVKSKEHKQLWGFRLRVDEQRVVLAGASCFLRASSARRV